MRFRLLRTCMCLVAITAAMCVVAYAFGTNEDDKEIVVSGTTDSGDGSEPTPWSYSFLKRDPSSKANLLDSNSGKICFEDGEWVVTTNESAAFQSNKKTDLAFYNSKTLELICAVQIPNCLRQFGRLPRSDIFFAVTQKYGKYNFDDAPLVLTVVNAKGRKLERIKLAEQDHWLANLPLNVKADSDGLTLQLTAERFEDFNKAQFRTPDFSILTVHYENNNFSQLPNPTLSVPKALRSMQFRSGENLYFGEEDNSSQASQEPRKASAAFIDDSEGPLYGTHLVRILEDGAIQDINISSLSQRTLALPGMKAAEPGIFESGALRCISDDAVVIADQKKSVIPIGKSKASFNRRHAFSVEWRDREEGTTDFWRKIDVDGTIAKCNVPEPLCWRLGGFPSIVVRPEAGIVVANSRARNGEGGSNVFRAFSMDDGKEIVKPLISETGIYGEASCVRISEAAGRYRLAGIITDFFNVNGNQRYSILLQDTNTGGTAVVAENLSGLPEVLECRVADDGHVLALFSCATMTRYVDFDIGTGKITVLQEWTSPSGLGPALFADGSNLLFVPKTYGYEVHRVFKSSGPERVCDMHLGASGTYAVSLPSGFYAGSPGCERLLGLNAGGESVDASALARWRNRPAEVIKALEGTRETAALLGRVTDRWLKRIGVDPNAPEPKASEIPQVEVTQMPPLWTSSAKINFPIDVAAGAFPLNEVTVRVNGIPQQRITGGDLSVSANSEASVQGAATLAEGQNWIEVTAIDSAGRVSNQARFRSILPQASEPPKRYIVAMGCSEYALTELNLEYAAKDAEDVLQTFRDAGGPESKTLLLTNKEVGPGALEKIKNFVSDSKESDEVILFCAGHGLLDEHFDYVYAGHQIDPEHPGETGIKLDALLDSISAGKSLKRLVLMDTCQSGTVGEQEEIKLAQAPMALPQGVRAISPRGMKAIGVSSLTRSEQQRFIEDLFLLPGQHRGINIIGASGGAEYAVESSQWKNGVFTSALIEAVRDKKADTNRRGRISVSDLKVYLAQRVKELTGGAQKPSVVAFEQDQDFDLIKVSNQTATRVASHEPEDNTRGATSLLASNIPNPATDSAEEVIRAFFAGLGNRDELEVSKLLDDRVDYYSSGKIAKTKVMADIKADWKRWSRGSFRVSDFQSQGASTLGFVLDYELDDGKRPRSGKLNVIADVTGSPLRIARLKYKVIAAD